MKFKKSILSAVLAAAMLLGLGAFALADDTEVAISPGLYYTSFTGTVTKVSPNYDEDGEEIPGGFFVFAENEDGDQISFFVNEDTYMFTDNELKAGATVTGYYLTGLPMIMIYPPQYTVKAMAVDYEGEGILVNRFDDTLLSDDGSYYINIGEHTEIFDEDGNIYTGESIANKPLAIFCDVMAMSYPAQASPTKIIVLNDDPMWPAENESGDGMDQETIDWLQKNVPDMEIVVENKIIDSPAAYADENGTVMLPLRAIAEELGFEVVWLSESRGVTLSGKYTLFIGQNSYSVGRAAPMELSTEPTLVNNLTYVPLDFFSTLLDMNNAYVFEGQIVIDNGEVMQ